MIRVIVHPSCNEVYRITVHYMFKRKFRNNITNEVPDDTGKSPFNWVALLV